MKKSLLLLIAACFGGTVFAQVTVNLTPDKDNSIYSENNNSNGLGALFSGYTCAGNSRRALIHFDVAGNIPSGATITAVTLTLNVQENGGSSTSEAYNLHPLNTNWGEGTSSGSGSGGAAIFPDATWNDAMLGTPWTSAGADFGASVATTNLTGALGNYNWTSAGMITNVQNWLNSPASNFGWILIGNESATCTARRFGSKDNGTAPVLSITYTCATPPTASCQNVSVYLNALGQYTLTGAEVNNGSASNCGGPLTYSLSQSVFGCSDIVSTSSASLILTAVYDGNLTGGLPKGVEVYVASDIADLSLYGLGSATNGGGTDGEEFTFPAISVTAGTYLYVASEGTEFNNFFGFMPDYIDIDLGVNGDDAIELFENGIVIDVFGEINVDGTGQPWEYTDGFAYRNTNTGPDGSGFNIGNWTLSGINALDPALTNGTAPIPVPIGTYTTVGSVPVTLTVTDQFLNTATCNASVMVIDTVGPTMDCVGPTTFDLDIAGNLTLDVTDIDAGTTDACGIQSLVISQTTFGCADLGFNQITLTATDIYGNTNSCIADITIQQIGGVMITEDLLTGVTCNGDSDGSVSVTISGGTSPYIIDWDNDGTGDNDDNEDITGLSGGTYTLTVSDQAGCTAQYVASITDPAVIEATLDVNDISCFGETDGLIDMAVTGGTIPYTFDWDNDGTGDFDDSEDLTNLASGTYTVVIEDDHGCIATFNETVLDASPVDVSVTQTGLSLTANAAGATYQWINCPGNTPVIWATEQIFNALDDGDYAVIVTDINGCSDTSICFTVSGVGFETTEVFELSVYPNPANQVLTISTALFTNPFGLIVTDINGRIVLQQTITAQTQSMDVSGLENGTYFITLSGLDKRNTIRFTVTR